MLIVITLIAVVSLSLTWPMVVWKRSQRNGQMREYETYMWLCPFFDSFPRHHVRVDAGNHGLAR